MRENASATARIGSAEVDTIIEDQTIYPGGTFSGTVVVEAGDTDQRIRGLEHKLVASTPDDDSTRQVTLDRWKIADEFTIGAGQRQEIPFEVVLHPEAPITDVDAQYNETDVWLETGLSVDRSVDSSDTDYLRVSPTDPIQTMLDAVESLGLELHTVSADSDYVTINGRQSRAGHDQEFDFRPTRQYTGPDFEEYQLHFVPRPLENMTQVLIEIEESGGLLGGDEEKFEAIEIDHVWGYTVEHLASEFRDRLYRAD